MKVLKNAKEAQQYRIQLLKKQKGIDPITGLKITDPVLDHCHANYYCRSVLQREVNSAEGRVLNTYNRYIKHLGISFDAFLEGLRRYHKLDFSDSPVHYTEISTIARKYTRLPAKKQHDILQKIYPDKDRSNSKKRFNLFKKAIKDERLNQLRDTNT